MRVYKTIKSKDLSFRHYELPYEERDISVWIEFIRYHAIRKIVNEMSKKSKLPYKLSFHVVLDFIWINMKSKYKLKEIRDAVIPYNGEYSNEIKEKLKGFDLKERMNQLVIGIEKFYESSLFEKLKRSFTYKIRKDKEWIYFDTNFESLKNAKKTISQNINLKMKLRISNFIYQKLQHQFHLYLQKHKHSYSFEELCISLILRYETINAQNEQLACSPEFYHDLKKKYNFNFELYGSAFNTQYTYFGSFFDDIEKYFMSQGPCETIECISGNYVANPPYDHDSIIYLANFIEDQFNKSHNKKPLSFFVTIPAWIIDEKHGDYPGYVMMKKSKYLTYFKEIPHKEARFYDYFRNKIVYPCGIFFLLFQNEKSKSMPLELDDLIHQHFRPFKRNIDLHYQPSSTLYQF